MSVKKFITAKNIFVITLIASLIAGGIYASSFPSVRETVALATTVKPETFTELYLENHLTLPKETIIKKAETFSFTIHNLEYKTMTYPYEVYIQDTVGRKEVLIKDIVKLKHDEKKTIPVYYELLQPVKRAKVVVNLIAKQQEIHFWIGEENK